MENIILIKEEIDCDRETAFNMFTKNELLENWLTVKAEVDPKVGGKYELFWVPENRESNSTIGCNITGIDRDKFISFDWKGPADFESFMNSADPLTHVIVFFSQNDSDSNKTIIHLFHTGWRNDSEWQKARNYFENAWSKALRVLKEKITDKTLP
ncbi:MAG: SRPBCC domain-containing protein [Candidatus Lokiarchaeota archaeon]|nr:SRPBCC domain-containing protein [Candidatus Lokiarchaeota archaeon]